MYYVAQDISTGLFAVYDKDTQTMGWTNDDQNIADWDHTEEKVSGYISRFNLPANVRPQPGSGLNHPPKPPMSAM